MALQQVPPFLLSSLQPHPSTATTTVATIDAAGESVALIGALFWATGSGTKTVSSSGGKFFWRSGAITFNNGSTNLRFGINDVNASGVEDGTHDVSADYVGGTDSIGTNTLFAIPFESGSKSIAHGDLVALVIEMTARGGADSVQVTTTTGWARGSATAFPYRTADTGSGPAKSSTALPFLLITADDGTLGWIQGANFSWPIGISASTVNLNTTSTPDEYAALFQVPFKCEVSAVGLDVSNVATTDDFFLSFYSDPLGTPVETQNAFVDADKYGATGANPMTCYAPLVAPVTLSPATWYGVACRPNTNNNVTLAYYALGSGNGAALKQSTPFGTNLKLASRTDASGAFSETSADDLPILYLFITALDDGASVGGGGTNTRNFPLQAGNLF